MFSSITQNWRGRPLESLEIIVNLIANTTTKTGLKIQAQLDQGLYQTGIKINDHEFKNSISSQLHFMEKTGIILSNQEQIP